MPEVLEHNAGESRERSDKVGLFRIVDGKVVEFPLASKKMREVPVELPKIEKWDATGPHDPEGDARLLDPITPEQIEEKSQSTQELADAVNDLMAESEKPANETLPTLDKMLRATTVEEFNELGERAKEESFTIEGKTFSGAELKQIVSEAHEALEKKKIFSAAKILHTIPDGPLVQKLEQLVDPSGLLGLMKEVETAYEQ